MKDHFKASTGIIDLLQRSKQIIVYSILLCVIVAATNVYAPVLFLSPSHAADYEKNGGTISSVDLAIGSEKCQQNQHRPVVDYNLAQNRLAALSGAISSMRSILRNANLIDGDGEVRKNATLIVL